MTYDELATQTIYVRKGAEHQRRLVTAKYRMLSAGCLVEGWTDYSGRALLITPECGSESDDSRLFYRSLDSRGAPVELHPACCSLAEFARWVEGESDHA